jgi:hypothetical protein
MNDTSHTETNPGELDDYDFYLPAVTLPPNLDRIEAVVTDLLDVHGVVLIPDTYNE